MGDRYGRVKIETIQQTKNDLRRAIQSEGTPLIQELWDRLEQWIDSPPMTQIYTYDADGNATGVVYPRKEIDNG